MSCRSDGCSAPACRSRSIPAAATSLWHLFWPGRLRAGSVPDGLVACRTPLLMLLTGRANGTRQSVRCQLARVPRVGSHVEHSAMSPRLAMVRSGQVGLVWSGSLAESLQRGMETAACRYVGKERGCIVRPDVAIV